MLPFEMSRVPTGPGGLFYGVYPAVVTELGTGEYQGYVKVRLPWSPDSGSEEYAVWARVSVLMAGGDRGTWFIPDEEDEVLVAFQGGQPDHPFVQTLPIMKDIIQVLYIYQASDYSTKIYKSIT